MNYSISDEPVQPRFELNAADLYIPSMAFVTYILVVGYVLGLNNRSGNFYGTCMIAVEHSTYYKFRNN